ncbi:MAG: HDOD domain-containing protein [Phycisphaerae bacterium]
MSISTPADAEAVVARALAGVGELATLPEVTVKIIELVEDPKSSARDLQRVMKSDAALSARILKVVNSAFYGLPGQISTVDRAIVLLGMSAVKNIAIAASMGRLFRRSKLASKFSAKDLWKHSLAVASASRMIVKALGQAGLEEAFVAGLIHDVGLLVEHQAFGTRLADVIRRSEEVGDFCAAEQELIGADHQAFGLGLTTKWKFPRHLRSVTGYHHRPSLLSPENRPLPMVVHIADRLSCQAGLGFDLTARGTELPAEELEGFGLTREQLEEVNQALPDELALTESILSIA